MIQRRLDVLPSTREEDVPRVPVWDVLANVDGVRVVIVEYQKPLLWAVLGQPVEDAGNVGSAGVPAVDLRCHLSETFVDGVRGGRVDPEDMVEPESA